MAAGSKAAWYWDRKLRVLHLTTHLNMGGITLYLLRLAEPLRALGIEMSVGSSGGELAPLFAEKNIPLLEVAIRTKSEIHPKIYFTIPAIIRFIKKNKIDILHAHNRVTQVLAFWIQRFTGIPVATTCHGFYKKRLGRKLLPAWGDNAIAISAPVAEHLDRDFGVPQKKIKLVYNGVDIESLHEAYMKHDPRQVKKEYGFHPDDPVIGIVARLVEDKGHEYLVRAIAMLVPDFPDLRLLIVGDGRERKRLESLVDSLNLNKHVLFTGNVIEITKPLSVFDVFAFPATWREGFGLSIAEAMACGKPVIVTNIWALNSLIQDKVTGLMIEPRQVQPLADALRLLLQNPGLRIRMGNQAKKMVEERFSISRMAREIGKVYQDLLRTS